MTKTVLYYSVRERIRGMMGSKYSKHIGGALALFFAVFACGIGTAYADTDWIILPHASESQ